MPNRILAIILIQTNIKINQIEAQYLFRVEFMRLSAKKKALLAVLGAAAGFINGFLGGGGGVLVVALMLAVLCLPQKTLRLRHCWRYSP